MSSGSLRKRFLFEFGGAASWLEIDASLCCAVDIVARFSSVTYCGYKTRVVGSVNSFSDYLGIFNLDLGQRT